MSIKTTFVNRPLNLLRKRKLSEYLFDPDGNFRVKWINYEFCSSCNLRCKWCSLDHSKKARFMDPQLLLASLEEIILDSRFRLERIDLHNAGETLMHPKLEEMLGIIGERKRLLEGTSVHLLTNGVLLDEKRARIILKSGALDELRVSIDGGTREYYDEIRIGSDWERVRRNLLDFVAMNGGRIKTGIICIVPPDRPLAREWMDEDFRTLFDRVDSVELRHPHNWDGSRQLDLPHEREEPAGRICKILLKNLVVLPDGDVTACCADLNSRGVVGNLAGSTLAEIYLCQERLKMLELYARGEMGKIELCRHCAGFYEE